MHCIRHVIIILAVIRLLAPPGICLCHQDSPVLQVLLGMVDPTHQPSEAKDDNDDHNPGCPSSPLAPGLGLIPAPVDAPCPLDYPREFTKPAFSVDYSQFLPLQETLSLAQQSYCADSPILTV